MAVMVAVVVAVVMAMVMAAVMAPGKGSGENPEKSSLRRENRFLLGFLIQDGARVGVIGTLINILPARKR